MLLEIKNLKTEFFLENRTFTAVNNVSFSIEKNKTVCIVGESGSGKSMLALSIMNLIQHPGKITQGEILFEKQNLVGLNEKEMVDIRGKDISMIFQEPMTSLNPSLTIGYQLNEVLKIHQQDLNKNQRKERVIELLELVNIPDPKYKVKEYPFKLSGGQRQRVMIAMAMACNPKLLIADEPTTALDVTIQEQILDLMNNLKKENDTSILFITHDLAVVSQIADEVIVVYKGNIVEKASSEELFNNPKHPYTKALLNSIPGVDSIEKRAKLSTVDENINYLDFPSEIR